MSEQKHFSYEANISMPSFKEVEFEVKDVQFLVPIKVDLEANDVKKTLIADIDLVNRKVFISDEPYNNEQIHKKILDFLNKKNTLPENHYEAKAKTYEEIDRAKSEQEIIEHHMNKESL